VDDVEYGKMKRELWTTNLYKYGCAAWPCPICATGTLKLVPNSLIIYETAQSKIGHADDEFDPEWTDYRFTAWATCVNQKCKQKVAIAGKGGVQQVNSPEGWDWDDYFEPLFWHPMPPLFKVPESCPESVKESLAAAFALYASDRPASAGRLRMALEALMDHSKVKRWGRNQHNRLVELSLHARLAKFKLNSPLVGDHLMALKWLGNAGSHNSKLSRDDLLDAFEVFEHALVEIIEERGDRVAGLAKGLAKKFARKRGPSSSRPSKSLF
jgi:hypothetical protein